MLKPESENLRYNRPTYMARRPDLVIVNRKRELSD